MVEEAAGMEKEAHGMEEDVKENKSDLVMCLKDDCMSIHTRKQHTEHYNKFHRGYNSYATDEEATFWNQKTLAEQRSYRKRVSSQLQSRQMSTRMSMAAMQEVLVQNNLMLNEIPSAPALSAKKTNHQPPAQVTTKTSRQPPVTNATGQTPVDVPATTTSTGHISAAKTKTRQTPAQSTTNVTGQTPGNFQFD
ncbi:hypothetical protein AaE_014681 [Aphanomyces astaci]|uniref:Uncharacterized protein n=1 Tax=Aphanomyces astaci TaxID=112090 RepID=A0A6A4Z0F7_APHAT|nr:hypothetical protein AaE_014681 [Aphanomyces astaci]